MSRITCCIFAGEVSGDRLAAGVMRELKTLHPNIRFSGVGGPLMLAEGMETIFPYDELALMGFVEILPKALHLLGRIDLAVEHIEFKAPDMVITIDSPGFNFRMVQKARRHNIASKYIHIVAPTVWAYKAKRAAKCATLFDRMLVLLPFEPPFFEKEGLKTEFIGHPTVGTNRPSGDGVAFKKRYRISDDQTVIALLPGSRASEVVRHMQVMSQTLDLVTKEFPDLVLVSAAPPHIQELIRQYFMASPYRNILLLDNDEKMDAFAAVDVALVKSGTVSLEMAYAGTPMVVMYKVHPITAWILKRLIKTNYASLVNIILDKPVIPEFLQEKATPPLIANSLMDLLKNPAQQQAQRTAFKEVVATLRQKDRIPATYAAHVISDFLRQ